MSSRDDADGATMGFRPGTSPAVQVPSPDVVRNARQMGLMVDMQDRITGMSVRLAAVQARIEALEAALRNHALL